MNPVDMKKTASGLIVPSELAKEKKRPPAPPVMLIDGVPVTYRLFGREEPEVIPLKGWLFEVSGVNAWAINLRLRCPTPKTLRKLGDPQVGEFGDLNWKS